MKRILSTLLLLFVILGILILCVKVIVPFYVKLEEYYRERADWKKRTNPLSVEVILDICEKFNLPKEDLRCQAGAVVYASEFHDDIKAYFRHLPIEKYNINEVDNKLGKYLFGKKPFSKGRDGTMYYDVWYDLQGDHMHPIIFSVNSDGSIRDIMSHDGGGS